MIPILIAVPFLGRLPGGTGATPELFRAFPRRPIVAAWQADRRTGELAIRLRGVVKRYGSITAVNGLDLGVPEGTCVGLLVFGLVTWRIAIHATTRKLVD